MEMRALQAEGFTELGRAGEVLEQERRQSGDFLEWGSCWELSTEKGVGQGRRAGQGDPPEGGGLGLRGEQKRRASSLP